jgi:predicted peroxiredoxin
MGILSSWKKEADEKNNAYKCCRTAMLGAKWFCIGKKVAMFIDLSSMALVRRYAEEEIKVNIAQDTFPDMKIVRSNGYVEMY